MLCVRTQRLGGLGAELVSQASSINHGLLSLFLGVLGLVEHLLEVRLKCSHFTLNLPLGGGEGRIQTTEVVDGLVSIVEFSLGMAASAVRLFQESARFFQLTVEGVGAALSNAVLLAVFGSKTLFILNLSLSILVFIPDLLIVFVEVGVGLVGVVKSDLELVDVGLKLLLQALSLSLALGLNLKGSLHGFQGPLVALASVLKLFLLLMDASVNLLPDLAEFKLHTEDLVLLLFEGGFSIFKGSLELFLLDFKSLVVLLSFMVDT